jgi:transcriptional regulator with XRE-family HTH domain
MGSTGHGLKEVREREGLTRAALGRAAGVSDRTLRRIEEGGAVSEATKGKVVKALNRLPDRLADYSVESLFPGG